MENWDGFGIVFRWLWGGLGLVWVVWGLFGDGCEVAPVWRGVVCGWFGGRSGVVWGPEGPHQGPLGTTRKQKKDNA